MEEGVIDKPKLISDHLCTKKAQIDEKANEQDVLAILYESMTPWNNFATNFIGKVRF